jgi:O-succinylhomoserine sulfhydrylase
MEGAEDGFAFATGMSSIFTTLMALCKSGDHILSGRSIFGSTHTLLTKVFPKYGIESSYADITDKESWKAGLKPNTKLLYVESPSNPGIDLVDLEWLGEFCEEHNLIYIVDNCFCTPYLQQPIKFGAHLSIHSATKFMDGQGRVLGGITVGNQNLIDEIRFFSRHSGPAMSPFNAWILSKSLETLAVRMDRHSENALKVADFLENQNAVEVVKYPFLKSHPQFDLAQKQMKQGGGVLSFVLKGGYEAATKFVNSLEMCSISANLGDTRTIVTHPASSTHSKLSEEERQAVGVVQGMIRISVGLENVDDIIKDLKRGL